MNIQSYVSRLLKTLLIMAALALSMHAVQAQSFQASNATLTATNNLSEVKDATFISSAPTEMPFMSKGTTSMPITPEPFKAPEPGAAMAGFVGIAGIMAGMRRKKAKKDDNFPYHMLKEYHSEFLD